MRLMKLDLDLSCTSLAESDLVTDLSPPKPVDAAWSRKIPEAGRYRRLSLGEKVKGQEKLESKEWNKMIKFLF